MDKTKIIERLNNRLTVLIPQFNIAIRIKKFKEAKELLADIQPLLKTVEKNAKLIEMRNSLFELALEVEDYAYAIEGFNANRKLVKKKTRLYLESTALLAICYLRINDFPKAKPYITEVLQNKNVIKSEETRAKFNEEIIKRFDEESVLSSLKFSDKQKPLEIDDIQGDIESLASSKNEIEIYKLLGKDLPKVTKDMLFLVDQFSKNQLTYEERKLLPSSEETIEDEKAGKTVFSALKRVIYNSICDPNSEVYKAWYTNCIGAIFDKRLIIGAIVLTTAGYGIKSTFVIIACAALLLRFGLDIYCERFRPATLTQFRRKSK